MKKADQKDNQNFGPLKILTNMRLMEMWKQEEEICRVPGERDAREEIYKLDKSNLGHHPQQPMPFGKQSK